jgi:acetoin utilization deacetylase AcuC-like enzyme
MNYPIYFDSTYVVPGRGLETVRKADEVARRILEQFPDIKLVSPEPATVEQLLLAHTAEYIKAFLSGEPYDVASAALGEWSEEVVASVLASTGGVIAAALAALESGKAGSLSSGLHHAKSDHGAGFCTINGLAIAALIALAHGANNVGILDVDAHCGGGTFEILGANPLIRIGDVSTSSFDSWRSGEERHRIEINTDPETYLDTVAEMLEHIGSVDLLLLNAGMDPADGGSAGSTRGFT